MICVLIRKQTDTEGELHVMTKAETEMIPWKLRNTRLTATTRSWEEAKK